MNGLQFGNNKDVEISGGDAILKMKCDGFTDVTEELVKSLALGENVFPNASRAPEVTVVVDFYFNQHKAIL